MTNKKTMQELVDEYNERVAALNAQREEAEAFKRTFPASRLGRNKDSARASLSISGKILLHRENSYDFPLTLDEARAFARWVIANTEEEDYQWTT